MMAFSICRRCKLVMEGDGPMLPVYCTACDPSFAQKEPEAPAGFLRAEKSNRGAGDEPALKTHASPARSARGTSPIVGGRRATEGENHEQR